MSDDRRTILLCGGGDWYDASATLLRIPASLDVEAEKKKRDEWYRTVFMTQGERREKVDYESFEDWLRKRCGAVDADDIEEVWET